jgi:dTDP-4-amino-4,6-dideoxygalactose transaminase
MQGTIPYATSFITDEDKQAVMRVLDSNWLTRGKLTKELEAKLCELTGKKHALVVTNGTVALQMAVEAAFELTVYSPTLTFSAVANAVDHSSCYPSFELMDVEADTLCTDWSRHSGLDGTIVAMDYAGYPSLRRKPSNHIGKVVLDAAHSLGATICGESNTKHADIATFSFHPAKLATGGEGGAVVCDDDEIYQSLILLRNNGIDPSTGLRITTGTQAHMNEMSVALLMSQLTRLQDSLTRRREIALTYMNRWKDDLRLILPVYDDGHSFHLFAIRLSDSVKCDVEQFRYELLKYGVGSQRHYRPIHLMPAFQSQYNLEGCFPVAEHAYERLVSIPMYFGITDEQVRIVMNAVDWSLDAYSK